ncbi:hypothetical protein GWA97_02690 [Flavobacterium sp. LaA7.5]|nr:hypothetical protein [Flavobacterium salilacus subsp. altitudinum]
MNKKLIASLSGIFCIILCVIACSPEEKDVIFNQDEFNQKNLNQIIGVADLPGREMAFIIDYDSQTQEFDKYYLFQYDQATSFIDVTSIQDINFIEYREMTVKFLIDATTYVFTIDDNYKNLTGEIVLKGYGLSEHVAGDNSFKFTYEDEEVNHIFDIIKITNSVASDDITCDSGGSGSTSCSTTGPFHQGSCSVSCSSGYACCNSTSLNCFCVGQAAGAGKIARKLSNVLKKPN